MEAWGNGGTAIVALDKLPTCLGASCTSDDVRRAHQEIADQVNRGFNMAGVDCTFGTTADGDATTSNAANDGIAATVAPSQSASQSDSNAQTSSGSSPFAVEKITIFLLSAIAASLVSTILFL